jgi:hypothetical protein
VQDLSLVPKLAEANTGTQPWSHPETCSGQEPMRDRSLIPKPAEADAGTRRWTRAGDPAYAGTGT